MKWFLVLTLVVAVNCAELLTDADKARIQSLSDACVTSSHVSKEVLIKMRNSQFEDDQHLKDYLFCIFKTMGWQKEDGTFIKEIVKAFVSKDSIAEEAMKPCIGKQEKTGPETAFAVFKCYKLNLPAGYKSTL